MSQEMSFAQALTEARQIIVQQSNRIKADLDRIKALQETIASQTAAVADSDRQLKQKTVELEASTEQVKTITTRLEEMKLAKEQGEAVIDRQGQRLTQMQETIAGLEKQLAEHVQKAETTSRELESIRGQVPTQEDTEALAALASLLSAKKGAAAPKPTEGAATQPEAVAAAA
jgi:predicted  nucleic acid-binding Zn-ribbon protein